MAGSRFRSDRPFQPAVIGGLVEHRHGRLTHSNSVTGYPRYGPSSRTSWWGAAPRWAMPPRAAPGAASARRLRPRRSARRTRRGRSRRATPAGPNRSAIKQRSSRAAAVAACDVGTWATGREDPHTGQRPGLDDSRTSTSVAAPGGYWTPLPVDGAEQLGQSAPVNLDGDHVDIGFGLSRWPASGAGSAADLADQARRRVAPAEPRLDVGRRGTSPGRDRLPAQSRPQPIPRPAAPRSAPNVASETGHPTTGVVRGRLRGGWPLRCVVPMVAHGLPVTGIS